MPDRSRRFSSDHVKNDAPLTPADLPDHLTQEPKEYHAELSNEQQAFNAQWFSKDHSDVQRDQRRYFFRRLEELQSACAASLYQFMPPSGKFLRSIQTHMPAGRFMPNSC